jgi:DNA-binding NarL/FixJ family response regulator
LDLVSVDLKNKEIARRLRISEQTVKNHLQHSFEKLGGRESPASRTLAGRTETACRELVCYCFMRANVFQFCSVTVTK